MDTQHFIKAVTDQGKFVLDWRNWMYGLVSGFVLGAATGGSAMVAFAVGHSITPDIHILNLKELGMVCLSGGIISTLAYLKQSPLPPKEQVQSVTTTVTDTHAEVKVTSPATSDNNPPKDNQ